MNKDLEIRKIAFETLTLIEKSNIPSHVVLRDVLDKYDYFSKNEKALISTIVKGVIERKLLLDYVLNQYSKVPVNKMKKPVRTILEMGTYQILFMKSYDSMAVNTGVELARKKGLANLSGFINAILRKISANKDAIKYPEKGDKNYLSVTYSMPEFLCDFLLKQYDFDTVETMLKASLESDTVRIRISERVSDDEAKAIEAEIKGIVTEFSKNEEFPRLLSVKGIGNISDLKAFKEGKIYIQDTGSYMLVKNVPYGKTILDACSAPGGKSIFLSERYPDAKITACDISEDKTDKIKENIERCKADNIEVKIQDATEFNPDFEEKFDVVLADVPCSGLGVIGKKSDIKYRLAENDFESLYELQRNILKNVSRYVKKDGYLCFSTCTVNKKENEEQVKAFLEANDFEFDKLTFVPESLKNKAADASMSLIQGVDDSDGFYFAVMKRV